MRGLVRAGLVACCLVLPAPASGGTRRKRATPLGVEEAKGLLADGRATKRTLTGRIDASNVHIVEEAIAKFQAALAVYEAALPGGISTHTLRPACVAACPVHSRCRRRS